MRARVMAVATATAVVTGAVVGGAGPVAATGGAVGGSGSWYYLNDDTTGTASTVLQYGDVGDVVHVADTDGVHGDSLLIRRGDEFFVRNSLTPGVAESTFRYGDVGDVVLTGDWDGDGLDTLAVRRGNAYFIKNDIETGVADEVVYYGNVDDAVLVGDWDGDGVDTLAVRRGNAYFIKDDIASGVADQVVYYGNVDDAVLVGAWNGTSSSLAVRRGNTYYLKDDLGSGVADTVFAYGNVDDAVLVGDWNGDGVDSLGVRRVQGPAPAPTPPPAPVTREVTASVVGEFGFDVIDLTSAEPAEVSAGSVVRFETWESYDAFLPPVVAGTTTEFFVDGVQEVAPGVWEGVVAGVEPDLYVVQLDGIDEDAPADNGEVYLDVQFDVQSATVPGPVVVAATAPRDRVVEAGVVPAAYGDDLLVTAASGEGWDLLDVDVYAAPSVEGAYSPGAGGFGPTELDARIDVEGTELTLTLPTQAEYEERFGAAEDLALVVTTTGPEGYELLQVVYAVDLG